MVVYRTSPYKYIVSNRRRIWSTLLKVINLLHFLVVLFCTRRMWGVKINALLANSASWIIHGAKYSWTYRKWLWSTFKLEKKHDQTKCSTWNHVGSLLADFREIGLRSFCNRNILYSIHFHCKARAELLHWPSEKRVSTFRNVGFFVANTWYIVIF